MPSTRYVAFGKRFVDLSAGIALSVLLLPIVVLIVVSLRLTLGSGVLFRQRRVGRHGKEFWCMKFRTMKEDRRHLSDEFDGSDRRHSHKSIEDPRHTGIGRFLRKYSLDELPQLINLIRGDMSLVGPRPEMALVARPEFVSHPRHLVRPGLTGPYQLSDLRLNGCLVEGLPLDEGYIQSLSFSRDIGILARTGIVVVRGTGN